MTTATRRLAAILAADVVGYSPLMGDHSVRLTSILLKNSNFRGDHNSEDRWQPRWKFPWGLSGATDLSAYDALLALAVASTRGDNAFRAEV